MKKFLSVIAVAFALAVCLAVTSFAANTGIYQSLSFYANAEDDSTVIYTQTTKDGTRYLFLPSNADLAALTLYYDSNTYTDVAVSAEKGSVAVISGQAFDLTALFDGQQDEYKITLTANGESSSVTVMKSANIRSMYIVSEDPVNHGRPWVDTSKSNEASGYISYIGADGEIIYSNDLDEIKGRGNSTFMYWEKKPYQIKLAKKADLIGGNDDEADKKWILLANAAESTLIHNSAIFSLGEAIGLPFTHQCEHIDLYYDGEYRGNYLLTEKTEVSSPNRIDIEDLDELIEDANKDTEAYDNPTVITATTASAGEETAPVASNGSYKYVADLVEPALKEGASHHGYLLELEITDRYGDELTGFVTNRGQCVVTKNPEYLTKETGAYISSLWQEFEDAVYSENGYNAATGKYYYEYCDLESLVNIYLVQELSKNGDGFRSSTFFYLDEDSDIMYAGPAWDFDLTFGVLYEATEDYARIYRNPENFKVATRYLVEGLLKIESFRDAVKAQLDKTNGEFYNAAMALLGEDGVINQQAAKIDASQKMNYKIWDINNPKSTAVADGAEVTYANTVAYFSDFLETRLNWLSDTTSAWEGDNYTIVTDDDVLNEEEQSIILQFIQKIIDFFRSIIEWFASLFK